MGEVMKKFRFKELRARERERDESATTILSFREHRFYSIHCLLFQLIGIELYRLYNEAERKEKPRLYCARENPKETFTYAHG